MNKKRATWVLIAMAALLIVTIFTAAVGWGPTGTGAAKNIKLGLDLSGGVSITYQTVGDEEPSAEDMSDTIYKLQQRVQNYSTEASVYQEGSNRINIEIPGVTDANAILQELGKPGSLTFQLEDGTVILNGTDVVSSEAVTQRDQTLGNTEYVVSLTFSEEGAKAFAEATSENVGNPIYIVYDEQVISAPTVRTAITDGKCVIEGSFTAESASNLASSIRIGSLSLELEEIRSNVVGAQLGEQAISTSLIAGLIGLIIVIIFMIIVYKVPGVIAGLSLAIYAGLELVALNAFDMTLTLAGIAGVILSIGMAVDANVIIYARIREEIASGKTVKSSIDVGFKKALSAIIDGNVTTLIAAIVLIFIKPVIVSGESMLPNLQDHDYLLLSRQAYTFGEPEHGQIVVFPVEKDDDRLYIKRVVGIPGDTLTIKNDQVYVNGKKQNQDFTYEHYTPGDIENLKIPKGKIFVMGDNRANSEDSRSDIVGLQDIDNISGVAILRLWPFSEFGTLEKYH